MPLNQGKGHAFEGMPAKPRRKRRLVSLLHTFYQVPLDVVQFGSLAHDRRLAKYRSTIAAIRSTASMLSVSLYGIPLWSCAGGAVSVPCDVPRWS